MAKKKVKIQFFDDSFYRLAESVTNAIEMNKDGSSQKEQVDELLSSEKKFKESILKYKQSTQVYKKFLQKVCIQNKNILSARPFFRESAITFSKKITPAIKDAMFTKKNEEQAASKISQAVETLKTFNINYQLIKFIKENWLGPFPKKSQQLFDRVHKARTVLIENNMPLAINRAKLFYRKTPKNHLSLLDMIGASAMGLSSGIDKYVGEYSKVFIGVCLGRIVGNLIEAYSETTLHFYPNDRRILYRAHSIRGRRGIDDPKELTAAINQSFKEDGLEGISVPKNDVEVGELNALLNAASTVSADISIDDEGFGVYSYTADPTQDIEGHYSNTEETSQMLNLASKLPLINKKILRLKGIKI